MFQIQLISTLLSFRLTRLSSLDFKGYWFLLTILRLIYFWVLFSMLHLVISLIFILSAISFLRFINAFCFFVGDFFFKKIHTFLGLLDNLITWILHYLSKGFRWYRRSLVLHWFLRWLLFSFKIKCFNLYLVNICLLVILLLNKFSISIFYIIIIIIFIVPSVIQNIIALIIFYMIIICIIFTFIFFIQLFII